jgi:hypothetical protein
MSGLDERYTWECPGCGNKCNATWLKGLTAIKGVLMFDKEEKAVLYCINKELYDMNAVMLINKYSSFHLNCHTKDCSVRVDKRKKMWKHFVKILIEGIENRKMINECGMD